MIKSTIASLLLLFVSVTGFSREYDYPKFLNRAILTIPPEYFADIPLDVRPRMLQLLSEDNEDGRLSYRSLMLSWAKDSKRDQGSIEASCSFAMKLFPRFVEEDFPSPYPPFVCLHLDREDSSDSRTPKNRIYVLMWKKGEWIDMSDKLIPDQIDRSRRYRIERDFPSFSTILPQNNPDGTPIPRVEKQLVVWQNDKLELRRPFPVYSDCTTDQPFDPAELASLALEPEKNPRRLMWLIVYAGLEKDEQFRYLLDQEPLKKNESVALALASYEYALDRKEEALDFIIDIMKKEGGGDTNSLLIISYMDEWEKSTGVLQNWRGDGAVGEAMYCFHEIRKYLYPAQYQKYLEKNDSE